MTAMFTHKKTQGLYTVMARVTTSLPDGRKVLDMAVVGIRKTDHGYVAVGLPNLGLEQAAVMQSEEPVENGVECVLYRGTDGRHWLRPLTEFTDGRFEPMNPQAACMMPATWHLTSQGITPR